LIGCIFVSGSKSLPSHAVRSVVREGENFIAVRVDLSPGKDTQAKRELLASYQHRGLPLVVLHNPKGEAAGKITSFVEPDEMLHLMQTARQN
jgi:thiol:disulfide interchange protein